MEIGKIASNVAYNTATKAVKSPVAKCVALGAAGVTTVGLFNHKAEADSSKNVKTAALLGTIVGGTALLFLAGKSTGASNKQALSAGFNMVKTGAKNLFNSAKATPVGQKISNIAAGVLNKAKSIIGKAKENPKMQAAAGKIKEAAGKIKDNPKIQAAAEKADKLKGVAMEKAGKLKGATMEKASKLKGTAMEKADKLKGAAAEKIKNAMGKLKDAIAQKKPTEFVQEAVKQAN